MAWTLPILCALALLTTVLFLRLLRQAKPIGVTPHCRRCDYTLTGNQSGRCPECGVELTPGNVILGDRPRRRALLACTLASLAALSFFGQRAVRQGDWYEYRPISWVLDDLSSPAEYTAFRAWTEIGRRRQIGKFSTDAECKLTDLALAAHARPYISASSIDRRLRDYLNTRFQAGSLTPAQSDRLYTQTFVPTLHVRPRIVAGDELPIWIEYTGFPRGLMRSKVENQTATIGGETLERHLLPDAPTPHYASKLTGVKVTKPGSYWITVEEDIYANLHMAGPLSEGFAWKRHVLVQKKIEVFD